MNKIDAGTLTRIIILALALINQGLALTGFNPIPLDEDALYQFISMVFIAGASIYAWYKDNPTSKEGKQANDKMKQLKAEKKLAKATGKSPQQENIDTEGDL